MTSTFPRGFVRLAAVLTLATAVAGTAAVPAHAATQATATTLSRPAVSSSVARLLTPPLPGLASLGTQLLLDGAPYRYSGVNAYELTTLWSSNPGCGTQVNDINGFFAALPTHTVVRVWAFQSLARNPKTGEFDFAGIDRVMAAAARHNDKVTLVLSNQGGGCDSGHWRNQAWYAGGYRNAYNDNGLGYEPLSFWSYLHLIVPRYANNSALGMWELVNEPEDSNCATGYRGDACYSHELPCSATAASTLRSFFDTVGGELKRLDPHHLLASGLIGSGQCGAIGDDYNTVVASKAIDVATYHDYGDDSQAVPFWLGWRANQTKVLRKPFIVEEVGVVAGPGGGCVSQATRLSELTAKRSAAFALGAAGWMPWDFEPAVPSSCNFDFGPGDPILGLLTSSI